MNNVVNSSFGQKLAAKVGTSDELKKDFVV